MTANFRILWIVRCQDDATVARRAREAIEKRLASRANVLGVSQTIKHAPGLYEAHVDITTTLGRDELNKIFERGKVIQLELVSRALVPGVGLP